jgi:hypothetical protein
LENAAECYETAIRIDPTSTEAHGNLAVARFSLADYKGAWSEVHLCQQNGGELPEVFLKTLSERMPEPP